jgi:hypothetical protein
VSPAPANSAKSRSTNPNLTGDLPPWPSCCLHLNMTIFVDLKNWTSNYLSNRYPQEARVENSVGCICTHLTLEDKMSSPHHSVILHFFPVIVVSEVNKRCSNSDMIAKIEGNRSMHLTYRWEVWTKLPPSMSLTFAYKTPLMNGTEDIPSNSNLTENLYFFFLPIKLMVLCTRDYWCWEAIVLWKEKKDPALFSVLDDVVVPQRC